MTPERWKQTDELVQAALERRPEDRTGFLDQACKADDALRQEVQSLLGYDLADFGHALPLECSIGIARVYARMGKANEARRMLAELEATTEPAGFLETTAARTYSVLGDKDRAFKVLFRLVEVHNNLATFIKADPPLDNLHSDPRWKELLRRMNFPTDSGK